MKRVLNFRIIVAVAGLFVTAGLFAQGTAIPGWDNGAGGDNYENIGSTYVTEGGTVPLYAVPDPYYHPSYVPATGAGITASFTWTWSEATTTLTFSQNNANDNYVAVTAPAGSAAGSPYTVNVTENSPFGGCNDGGTNITVNVVTAPAVAFSGTSITAEDCEGGTFPAAIEAVISGGYQAYRLVWSLQITTLDDGGATEFYYTDETGAGQSVPAIYAVQNTQASPDGVAASGNYDITTVPDFLVINNGTTDATTVYTYTLSGLNDQASRWSDFLAIAALGNENSATAGDFTYYDTADETITITVHPTPTTGPIFHIDSGWAN